MFRCSELCLVLYQELPDVGALKLIIVSFLRLCC